MLYGKNSKHPPHFLPIGERPFLVFLLKIWKFSTLEKTKKIKNRIGERPSWLVISHPKNPKIENCIGERPFYILNLKVFLPRKIRKSFRFYWKSPKSSRFYQIKTITRNGLSPRVFLNQKPCRWEDIFSYNFNLIKSEWFWAFSREKNFKIQNIKWPLTYEVFDFGIFRVRDYKSRWPLTYAVFDFFVFSGIKKNQILRKNQKRPLRYCDFSGSGGLWNNRGEGLVNGDLWEAFA